MVQTIQDEAVTEGELQNQQNNSENKDQSTEAENSEPEAEVGK